MKLPKASQQDLEQLMELFQAFRHTLFHEDMLKRFSGEMRIPHIKTLLYLSSYGDSQMSAVSSWVGLQKGSFTPVATQLMQMGYVERTVGEDRRKVLLRLTPSGQMAINEIFNAQVDSMRKKLTILTEGEYREFFQCVTCLQDALDRMTTHQP